MSRLFFHCRYAYRSGFRLDAAFEAGEGPTALFGPSGSGKSTVLALIAGLLRPHEGVIRLGERTLSDVAGKIHLPPERRNVGLVFQDHCLFPHLTVRQNLEYGLRRQRKHKADFEHVVEILEIGELLSFSPRSLSGGERQRVALGRALLQGPELLLLDEPLTGLQKPLQDRILVFLKRILRELRLPMLLVTHDLTHVHLLAQHLVLIDRGRVVWSGDPRDERQGRIEGDRGQ